NTRVGLAMGTCPILRSTGILKPARLARWHHDGSASGLVETGERFPSHARAGFPGHEGVLRHPRLRADLRGWRLHDRDARGREPSLQRGRRDVVPARLPAAALRRLLDRREGGDRSVVRVVPREGHRRGAPRPQGLRVQGIRRARSLRKPRAPRAARSEVLTTHHARPLPEERPRPLTPPATAPCEGRLNQDPGNLVMQIREARKLIGKRVLGHGVVGTLEEIHPGRGRSWCVLRAEELREWSTKYAMGDRVTVGIMNLRAWPHPPQGWLASVEQAWVRAYDHARRDVEGGPGARPNWMFEEARERLALLTRARPTSLPPSEPRPRTTPKPVLIFTPEGPVHVYRFEPPTQQPASAASAYIRFARTRCGLSEETHHVAHSRFDRGVPLDAPSPEELPWCQTCR